MNEELKPCPFCGHEPRLENDGFEKCRNEENGDLITRWRVYYPNCGCKKDGGITEYRISNNEEMIVLNNKNGKKTAIEIWNRRVGDE
jgi:DnaJ-class molecular chaperone